ncbi:MAG: hypothetical protein HY420_01845 [Candidatus Kerfeldbacteria bacterium]|nr:hypothetical protein [Candidatus Kerfeldbacteria bacterium]
MKRYVITAMVLLVGASFYSMWRVNCHPECDWQLVALGLPIFLKTPYLPDTGIKPEFWLVPFVVNVVWSAAVSFTFWAVVETGQRWRRVRQQPPTRP